MNAKSFHISVQGASHIKKNKECQDASSSYQDENCAIAIVCDGHGGDDYFRSAIGSTMACAVAEKNIKKFMLDVDKETFFSAPDKHLKTLEASIINGWNEAIANVHSNKPFLEKELSTISDKARKRYVEEGRIESAYGTTMIAVAMGHDFWFGIHIGDGKCVAINPEGEFKQPIPWDPKCFLNATTSICDSYAIERFRHFYSEKLPAAVFVGSDGIDDCFKNNEQLHNLYKTVIYSFATTDFDEAFDGLKDYLPRLSAKGSGDDVSVAAILDMTLIPELSIVKEYDREKEKARVEENARKEAEKNEEEKRRVEEEHARFQQRNNRKEYAERNNSTIICPGCGERLKKGVRFCSYCGIKLDPDFMIDPIQKPAEMIRSFPMVLEDNGKIAFSSEPAEAEEKDSVSNGDGEELSPKTSDEYSRDHADDKEIENEEKTIEINEGSETVENSENLDECSTHVLDHGIAEEAEDKVTDDEIVEEAEDKVTHDKKIEIVSEDNDINDKPQEQIDKNDENSNTDTVVDCEKSDSTDDSGVCE